MPKLAGSRLSLMLLLSCASSSTSDVRERRDLSGLSAMAVTDAIYAMWKMCRISIFFEKIFFWKTLKIWKFFEKILKKKIYDFFKKKYQICFGTTRPSATPRPFRTPKPPELSKSRQRFDRRPIWSDPIGARSGLGASWFGVGRRRRRNRIASVENPAIH